MTMHRDLLNYIYSGVIAEYAKLADVSIREAFDALYTSRLYGLISRGVSDMHCRSNGYLAEELLIEVNARVHP